MIARYRKKVVSSQSVKKTTLHVDYERDQVQILGSAHKKLKNIDKIIPLQNDNPYEQIKLIPQIELTMQQMNGDPIELIMSLQLKYKEFGAIKIKACPQWNPPFNFKYTQKGITTRVQKIHKLKQGKAFDQKLEEYNIKSFTNYAQDFQSHYKFKFPKKGKTDEAQLQFEYWRIVKGVDNSDPKAQQKYKVTIQYAADLPVHKYGSGFPMFETSKSKDSNFNYATSLFNINNIYKSPCSILKITDENNQKISGVTVPWVYMGMLFSSFCWHVEDLWLNSINYSHTGATKTWYIIPESDKDKFDQYVLKKTGKRELLNSITFMIDPIELVENGIKVCKAYQRPREYILTLFNAYHCGFSQGYNVGQAVNIGSIDSLKVIKKAQDVNALQKNHKPPVICYEWLIVANLKNPSINQEIIQAEYSKIVLAEFMRLKKCVENNKINSIETVESTVKYDRLSCQICKYYQYLSVLRCVECSKKYCLVHADKCCGKGFIFMTREIDSQRKKNIDLVRLSIK